MIESTSGVSYKCVLISTFVMQLRLRMLSRPCLCFLLAGAADRDAAGSFHWRGGSAAAQGRTRARAAREQVREQMHTEGYVICGIWFETLQAPPLSFQDLVEVLRTPNCLKVIQLYFLIKTFV